MNDNINLVMLFDGTDNTMNDLTHLTNVAKIKEAIAYDGIMPEAFYANGVGTQSNDDLTGSIAGLGIKDRLGAGFRWLTNQYNDKNNLLLTKRIYLFGFSRGAYIARTFAKLIYRCGIPNDSNKCQNLLDLFWNKDYEKLSSITEQEDCYSDIEIDFLGVWDTVKSAIALDFEDEELASNVLNAGHAMSLDEKRKMFPILKWKEHSGKFKQMWFAGIHSDIGGGYDDAGLSDITLFWMLSLAKQCGLKFQLPFINSLNRNAFGTIHNEADKPQWKMLGKCARIYAGEEIHKSVELRIANKSLQYKPYADNFPA